MLSPNTALHFATLTGTAVFAASGALAAVRRNLDVVGALFVGAVTGIGGGTLRDVLIGDVPVPWVANPAPLTACLLGACAGVFGARILVRTHSALLWADAAGLALFSATGAAKGLAAGVHPATAVLMGVITATFGGIMRDVVCNEMPVLLYREIYITAAAVGASVFVVGSAGGHSSALLMVGAIATTFAVRAAGIVFGLSLPGTRGRASVKDTPRQGPEDRPDGGPRGNI